METLIKRLQTYVVQKFRSSAENLITELKVPSLSNTAKTPDRSPSRRSWECWKTTRTARHSARTSHAVLSVQVSVIICIAGKLIDAEEEKRLADEPDRSPIILTTWYVTACFRRSVVVQLIGRGWQVSVQITRHICRRDSREARFMKLARSHKCTVCEEAYMAWWCCSWEMTC